VSAVRTEEEEGWGKTGYRIRRWQQYRRRVWDIDIKNKKEGGARKIIILSFLAGNFY
jgi:hypothetical protein